MFHPKQAYNDLPMLPPKADVETKEILKRWGLARAALAELRLAGQAIPDQSVLIGAIPLLEAKDSSEIENIVTTNDALFREAGLEIADGDPGAKEALRYRSALYHGLESIKRSALRRSSRASDVDKQTHGRRYLHAATRRGGVTRTVVEYGPISER
jgi:Fic family protein